MIETTVGLLCFDGMEELDLVGPFEVLASVAAARDDVRVLTVAQRSETVRCAHGLGLVPDVTLDEASDLDVVLVPGGQGTRIEVDNPVVIDWIRKVAPNCSWVTSVCTGALLLCEAGLASGRRVTTHWGFIENLRVRYPETEVLERVRYVRDGNLLTSAGVSAGIDMSLWLTGQIWGVELARNIQKIMEYDPAPPYTAEV